MLTIFVRTLNPGADVICAEMVSNPMQLYAMDSSQALSGPDEIQFLLTIRSVLERDADLDL
jgi:hypothetical protein